jgi:hypothetical protein
LRLAETPLQDAVSGEVASAVFFKKSLFICIEAIVVRHIAWAASRRLGLAENLNRVA